MEMLNEMAVFVRVVDSAGFSAAARQIGLTTSAVSRHVTRLEAHLGGRLLQRTTRSVRLTELGEQVYAGCTRMLSAAREVQAGINAAAGEVSFPDNQPDPTTARDMLLHDTADVGAVTRDQ